MPPQTVKVSTLTNMFVQERDIYLIRGFVNLMIRITLMFCWIVLIVLWLLGGVRLSQL